MGGFLFKERVQAYSPLYPPEYIYNMLNKCLSNEMTLKFYKSLCLYLPLVSLLYVCIYIYIHICISTPYIHTHVWRERERYKLLNFYNMKIVNRKPHSKCSWEALKGELLHPTTHCHLQTPNKKHIPCISNRKKLSTLLIQQKEGRFFFSPGNSPSQ